MSLQSCFFWSVTSFSGVTAGCEAVPGTTIPSASTADAIVHAVNMACTVGHDNDKQAQLPLR